MNKLWIVTKHEFYRYFISPLAYVYLICFLLLNGSFAVYFGNFFERGHADLLSMFNFQPWLYLLFIPGISMRLWAEEFRTKTILQIITMPVSVSALVWGKFLASWLFCALALILTFPFWITVNLLGNPDNAVIAVSYLGSFLLAGCMLSISQTMSALTKNQVIALVLAVIANLVFFLSGIEYILGIFRSFAPLPIIDMIASFSFLTHFETITRGLLELRDIVFFASLIILFNFTTILVISFKTSGTTPWLKSNRQSYYIIVFLLLLGTFTGLNLIANNTLRRFQYDFTEEKLYTLTPSTIKILQNLPQPVTAKLYYSPLLGERNPDVRLMFDKVRLLLQRYSALSGGKFTYRIYSPVPLSDNEDRALAAGIQPLPIIDNSTNAYFGLTLTDEVEKRRTIPYFPLERQDFLEQDLTENIYLLNAVKPKLGIITSLPVFEDIIGNVTTAKWEIVNQLSQFYQISEINNSNPQKLSQMDALLIAHPQDMSPELEKTVMEFSNKGGKILAFFDIAAEAPRIFSPVSQTLKASNFGTLPQQWGFQFHDEAVVADLENSSTIDATVNYKNNPDFTQDLIQFYLRENSFNKDFKETRQLKKMMLTSASIFTPLKDAPIFFIPLLEASANSALLPSEVVYNSVHPAEILRHFEKDANPKYLAARIISKKPSTPFDLIVVGDSDLLYDNFWTVHQTVLENNYAIPILDNANFVLNALDILLNHNDLIDLRGKSGRIRSFNDIETKRRLAQQQFKIKEKDILDSIQKTKTGLQEIWNKRSFEGRSTFTPDELALIAGIRKTIDRQRRELYEIRSNINQEITQLENRIKFINIYALPLFILLGMLVFLFQRTPRLRTDSHLSLKPNRQLLYLAAITVLLLSTGIAAVYYNDYQSADTYEGKQVFPELFRQINDVDKIVLQNHNHKLTFIRQDNLWQLENQPHLMVYQERIRSFLSALIEAQFYEKRSAQLENLPLFGLAPVETIGSPNIRVELINNRQKVLTSFNIGKYDIDLGRGSKGAYLKFDNQFQVWLASIDLIDLSLDSQEWTYSTIWNLRFGRLASINGLTDSDYLANVAKDLLNTHFTVSKKSPLHPQLSLTINILAEGDNRIDLNFYKSENKYYLRYEFLNNPQDQTLQIFQKYTAGIYYEISAEDMEKIKNVVLNPAEK